MDALSFGAIWLYPVWWSQPFIRLKFLLILPGGNLLVLCVSGLRLTQSRSNTSGCLWLDSLLFITICLGPCAQAQSHVLSKG